MLTISNSLIFSALMGLRSLVPVLLSFFLVKSVDPGASELMLALQTAAIYGSIIYLIFFNTLSIEYARLHAKWLDVSIRGLVVLFILLGLYIVLNGYELYAALIVNTILASLVFIRARVLLVWKFLLAQSALVVGYVIYVSLTTYEAEELIRKWLLFYFISSFFVVIGCFTVEPDSRVNRDRLHSLLLRIPKIAFVSVLFMLVMLIERYVIDGMVSVEEDKKEFLFFVSIINVVAIVGSGFLSILGPRVAKSKAGFIESILLYKKIFFVFGVAQLILGLVVMCVLHYFMGFSNNFLAYLFKILLLVSVFYYQLLNQSYQFTDRHALPVVNSIALVLSAIMAWCAAIVLGEVSIFYMVLCGAPAIVIVGNLIYREKICGCD